MTTTPKLTRRGHVIWYLTNFKQIVTICLGILVSKQLIFDFQAFNFALCTHEGIGLASLLLFGGLQALNDNK